MPAFTSTLSLAHPEPVQERTRRAGGPDAEQAVGARGYSGGAGRSRLAVVRRRRIERVRVLDVIRRDQPGEGDAERPTEPLRTRRWGRISLRIVKVGLVVLLVLAAAIGLLFVFTPSAGEATALVQDQAGQHGIGYPGAPVPGYFAQALVATEDKRFYSDPGVDPLAIGRVVLAKVAGKQDQGGSTIAQQLAKMLYTQGRSGVKVELEQVTLAVKLNMTYKIG